MTLAGRVDLGLFACAHLQYSLEVHTTEVALYLAYEQCAVRHSPRSKPYWLRVKYGKITAIKPIYQLFQ